MAISTFDGPVTLDLEMARVLCHLSSVPQRLADLTADLGDRPIKIRAAISAARLAGWPISGNPVSGYSLVFDDSLRHTRMRWELEAYGNQLYGGG